MAEKNSLWLYGPMAAMDPTLLAGLRDPRAYPNAPLDVEVVQTHISCVFLAGDAVCKVKKPVRFSFLDFSTLERRRHFCEAEVRLNRRLAPAVYRGVVPIVQTQDGYRVGRSVGRDRRDRRRASATIRATHRRRRASADARHRPRARSAR